MTSKPTATLVKLLYQSSKTSIYDNIENLQAVWLKPGAYRLRFLDLSNVMAAAAMGAAGNSAGWTTAVTSSFLMGTPM
jgi:hypothetical protein